MGYKVIGVDRSNASPWIRSRVDLFVPGDFSNPMFIKYIIDNNPEALIHIAGTSLVGPSVTDPGPYYYNNVGNTARMLADLAKGGWKRTVVYSSSAAIYGNPTGAVVSEDSDTLPISPYGHSKLMAEQVLRDCANGYGFKTIAFRYFNACGGDSKVRHGQLKQATHLIARVIESIINKSIFTLNGTNYKTPDGTCVRDYLHVEDIANAHYLAVAYAKTMSENSNEFNLGTGRGTSIKEIIAAVEHITGQTVLTHLGSRREGDPATLVASAYLFKKEAGWNPDASNINNIVRTAWDWYQSVILPVEYKNRA